VPASIARFLFFRYWAVFSISAAVGEWTLWCWFAGPPARPILHVIALALLAATNRLAALAYEREDARGPVRHRLGGTILAAGLVSCGGAAGVVIATLVGLLVVRAGGLSAEAESFPLGADPTRGSVVDLLATLGMLGGMGLVIDGYLRGHRRLEITRFEVTLPHLSPELDGLRVVHLSDLHVGPLAHAPSLLAALDRAVAEQPDLVVVTGDIVDSPATDLAAWLPELDRVRAPLGVYAILGNHDGFHGHAAVAEGLRTHTHWRVLRDETHWLQVGAARLALVGLEDRHIPHESDALPALAAALPPDAPVLLLAHHPNVFAAARRAGLPLTLVGHTHGGQIAVPGAPSLNAARVLITRFDRGTFLADDCVLHVSRGLGTSGQRVRIGVPRDITVITLRSSAAA
jgi:predicted MPP superfamily phosphohydrolase